MINVYLSTNLTYLMPEILDHVNSEQNCDTVKNSAVLVSHKRKKYNLVRELGHKQ